MLGTLNRLAFHQTFGEMHVAVGADTIRGIELTRYIAVEREGLPTVIEANYIPRAEVGSGASLNPTLGVSAWPARQIRHRAAAASAWVVSA